MSNIAIIDNLSPPETKEILRDYERRLGLKVIYDHDSYIDKGPFTYTTFQKFFPNADLAIPLDSDEFLVGADSKTNKPDFSIALIRENLYQYWKSNFTCFIHRTLYNACNKEVEVTLRKLQGNGTVPEGVQPMNNYTESNQDPIVPDDTAQSINSFSAGLHAAHSAKRFFKFANLIGLDHGSHRGNYTGECTSTYKKLALLHYHNRNLHVKVQRALRDCIGFEYFPTTETLETVKGKLEHITNLINTPLLKGVHKLQEIKDYIEKGLNALRVPCPASSVVTTLTLPEIIKSQKKELEQMSLMEVKSQQAISSGVSSDSRSSRKLRG